MRTLDKAVTKDQFIEILEFSNKIKQHSLIFSQDLDGNFWPIPGKGLSEAEDRHFVIDGPVFLHQIANIHHDECPEGGKFQITFCGGWSFLQKKWFIRWRKDRDLVLYEHSVPVSSTKGIDLYAMRAKLDPSSV